MNVSPNAVEPSVFNFVRDYAIDVAEAARHHPKTPVPIGPLLVFAQSFYAQFFNSLNITITDFSDRSHKQAAKLRIQMTIEDNTSDDVISLISHFESFCEIHPDITNQTYGADNDELEEFMIDHFPELLRRVVTWAEGTKNEGIRTAAQSAIANYNAALAKL